MRITRASWWLRALSILAGAAAVVAVGATPALAAEPSAPGTTPVIEIVPAFDNDLPLSGLALSATGLQARPNSVVTPAADWVCSIYASDPTKFANTIEGEGFQSCSGINWSPQRVKVTLQRYLGLGFWNNLTIVDSGYVYINFVQRDFIFDCSTQGTQTYRVVTDGFAVGGLYSASVQSLNYLRVACP